jgi:hypothetical protein
MSDLEDRIRAGLNADRAVPDLWEAVYAGSRRRTRRTAAATALVAAVAVAIIASFATTLLVNGRDAQPAPAEQPSGRQQVLDPNDWDLPAGQFLDGATPTATDLVGLWRVRTSDDAWLMLLGADGYWTTTNGWDLFGGGDVGNRGTWSLSDGRITLHGREGFLGSGFKQVLDVALMPDGSLHQVTRPREGRCTGDTCSAQPERFLFDRVAPGSSLLLESLDSASASPIPDEAVHSYLPGVWVSTDGQWVVTIDNKDVFRAFRDSGDPSASPDDGGRVEIDDRGHLSMACRGGLLSADVVLVRTEPVDGLLPSGMRMTSDVADSSCESGLGETLEWIRVSERG